MSAPVPARTVHTGTIEVPVAPPTVMDRIDRVAARVAPVVGALATGLLFAAAVMFRG